MNIKKTWSEERFKTALVRTLLRVPIIDFTDILFLPRNESHPDMDYILFTNMNTYS